MTAHIFYEEGQFYVTRERVGKSEAYIIHENGATAAKVVAKIGCSLGWQRVIAEISRRRAAANLAGG